MSKNPLIRLGTRGSELALAQAELTTLALRQAHPNAVIERIIIHTTGDKRLDVKLTEFHQTTGLPLDKGAFTKELELALEEGKIDVAVHSLKDVPTKLGAGFFMAATTSEGGCGRCSFHQKRRKLGWHTRRRRSSDEQSPPTPNGPVDPPRSFRATHPGKRPNALEEIPG
jgi:hypothetical protein